jgi:hypothetical protein
MSASHNVLYEDLERRHEISCVHCTLMKVISIVLQCLTKYNTFKLLMHVTPSHLALGVRTSYVHITYYIRLYEYTYVDRRLLHASKSSAMVYRPEDVLQFTQPRG